MSTRCAPLIPIYVHTLRIPPCFGQRLARISRLRMYSGKRFIVPKFRSLIDYAISILSWTRDAWLGPRTVTIQCFVAACLLRGGFL